MEKDQSTTNEGTGRVNQPGQPSQQDISNVDQQEGTMNNGALGGNFNESGEEQMKDPNEGNNEELSRH